jgi:predicted dienelactone hydrolase
VRYEALVDPTTTAPAPLRPPRPHARDASRVLGSLVLAVVALALPVAAATPDVTGPGPYTVGRTTVTFTKTSVTTGAPRPLATVIWYPAEPGTGSATGSVLGDAEVKRGHWPLLLFSHGLCGIPTQSTFFTTALASWGFVVAAPPHPGGELTDGVPQCVQSIDDSFQNRVPDIQFVIDRMLAANREPGSRFARHLKPRRIGVSGHSFGGQTALRVAYADARVRAALALAPALYGDFVSQLHITTPTMIMTGDEDTLAPFDTNARPYYAELFGPRYLVEILNTGHSAFADRCRQDCKPGDLTQDEAHALVLRHAVPFLLRYVAGRRSVSALLRPENAPPGAPIVDYSAGRR